MKKRKNTKQKICTNPPTQLLLFANWKTDPLEEWYGFLFTVLSLRMDKVENVYLCHKDIYTLCPKFELFDEQVELIFQFH